MEPAEHNPLPNPVADSATLTPAAVLAAVQAAGAVPDCAGHPGTAADAICPVCHRAFCWSCIAYEPETDLFRCRECEQTQRDRQRRRRWLKLFRMPFFYIVIVVVLALIGYSLGIGNPTPARLARSDAGKPWFTRELGMQWLQQAVRVRLRAAYLELAGRTAETTAWAGLAREAYLKSAATWHGEAIAADPTMAAAVMTSLAGDPRLALKELDAMTLPAANPSYFTWLYLRGRIALKAGDTHRAQTEWNALMKTVQPPSADITGLGAMIEKMASSLQFDKPEEMVAQQVRSLCRTGLSLSEVKTRIKEEAKEAGLTLETPPRSAELFGVGEGLMPEPEPQAPPPPSPKAKGKLVIERFEPKK